MQEAWLRASLEGEEQIRSLHLLMALVEKPSLIRCDGLWPLLTLAQSQLERLHPVLDAQSDERLEVQQVECLRPSLSTRNDDLSRDMGVSGNNGLSDALRNALDKLTLDVTARARDGKIDPVFGRDNEIRQMVDILSRRRKNNPILVGEPGVGKTALVEGLALRVAEGNVPDSLKPVSVRTLDLGLLQAGAGVKGEFEQRLKNIIEAVQQSPLPVLLFIDEAHTIIGAGNQAGGADAANLLKPALARGELRTIAATTWSEYKQYFERDAALERRFQMVKVDEPDDDTACLMLRGLKSRYAEHHGVHITDEAVRAAVTLSRRYLTGRQLPDKAVDLLDTASARIRMSLDTIPEPLTRLKVQLTALAMEKQALLEDIAVGKEAHREPLAAIERDEVRIILQLDELETQYGAELKLTEQLLACRSDISRQAEIPDLQQQLRGIQQTNPLLGLDVDARTVATVIADWTGVPLSSLMKDEQTELLSLEHSLSKRVVGQDAALNAIAQRLRASKTGLTPENGAQGVFLLVGPSGVGKTETALALADVIRARKGLFVSADAQLKAQGDALDRDTALKEIDRLNQQLQQLKMAAEQAQTLKADVDSQIQMFEQRLKPLNEAVLFSAPEGMALTSGEHLQMTATKNVAINAGEDINAGVMGNMTALAGEKLGLFARTGQLSLKSGEGPVEVQAQNASLRLFAEKKLTLSSASDISFAGKKRITLIGGGSYLRLEAGKVEYGTTATYIRKVKRTMFAGANSTPTPSISMPLVDDLIRNGFFDEQFRILDDSGKPMANVPYFISSENGETFKGVTDNQGLCKRVFSKESAKLTVWLGVLALERW
ncbi:TPA: DUF2345 domain-containing protein [Klebsiella variicola]|nr:DUF2345 domain-containing protein [Klebsiella variicola]